jgi:hypothetical protein
VPRRCPRRRPRSAPASARGRRQLGYRAVTRVAATRARAEPPGALTGVYVSCPSSRHCLRTSPLRA